jgi:hypothetical protein
MMRDKFGPAAPAMVQDLIVKQHRVLTILVPPQPYDFLL